MVFLVSSVSHHRWWTRTFRGLIASFYNVQRFNYFLLCWYFGIVPFSSLDFPHITVVSVVLKVATSSCLSHPSCLIKHTDLTIKISNFKFKYFHDFIADFHKTSLFIIISMSNLVMLSFVQTVVVILLKRSIAFGKTRQKSYLCLLFPDFWLNVCNFTLFSPNALKHGCKVCLVNKLSHNLIF